LNFKQIPHVIKPVDLKGLAVPGETNQHAYQANPMRYLPALKIDGHTLIESMAIMEYLEETRPEYPLLPQDPYKRAKVREICEVIISGIQPLQNIGVLNHMGDFMGSKEKAWSQHWINRGFKALEKLLSSSSGMYCIGDEVTIADCCLVPQVYNARRYFQIRYL
jgi:maleylacetoacetate isomerase